MNTKDIEKKLIDEQRESTLCWFERDYTGKMRVIHEDSLDCFIEEMVKKTITTLTEHHEAEVERRVEAERERIRKWVEQRISHELGDVIAASEGAYRPTEIEIAEEEAHNRAIKCVLNFLTPTKTDKTTGV